MNYCAVYKTRKKAGMFLYVPEKDQFEDVPKVLMAQLDKLELVMILPLNNDKPLASIDKATLIQQLSDKGFYLQMPPKSEDWLAEHRTSLGLSAQPVKRD